MSYTYIYIYMLILLWYTFIITMTTLYQQISTNIVYSNSRSEKKNMDSKKISGILLVLLLVLFTLWSYLVPSKATTGFVHFEVKPAFLARWSCSESNRCFFTVGYRGSTRMFSLACTLPPSFLEKRPRILNQSQTQSFYMLEFLLF